MDEDTITDLKQFISSQLSQSEQRIKDELKGEIKKSKDELRSEMRDGFAGVGDAIEQINQRLDDKEKEDNKRDRRITRLEQLTA